jgi:hypothetical protein
MSNHVFRIKPSQLLPVGGLELLGGVAKFTSERYDVKRRFCWQSPAEPDAAG